MSTSSCDLSSQAVFQHGMVSPSPLDDVMFAPQAGFQFQANDLDANFPGMMNGDVAMKHVGMAQPINSMTTQANNKSCPLTPTSNVSQLSNFVLDDPAGRHVLQSMAAGQQGLTTSHDDSGLSSILDKPKTSPGKSNSSSREMSERQGKAKKQRRQSAAGSAEENEQGLEGKDRSREKNKIAAAKCRAKKRDNMEVIESSHRTLSAENSLLRRQEQQLRATVAELRTLALDHQNCSCGVHQYNMLEARKLAHGLSGLCSMSALGMINTMPADTRRKHSDSSTSASPSSNGSYHDRAHSFAAPVPFSVSDDLLMQNPMFGGEQGMFGYDPSLDHKHNEQ